MVAAVLASVQAMTAAATPATARPTRITRRAPARSVQAPATLVASTPETPASAYSPIRSAEYEYGGCERTTANPDHRAQKAKNHRAPPVAAPLSTACRANRPGRERRVAPYRRAVPLRAGGTSSRQPAATSAQAVANTRSVARQPISSVNQPPAIRPVRIPAEIPAVTMPRTVARRFSGASLPATELRPAPTAEHAPTKPVSAPSTTTPPATALAASTAARTPNCAERTRDGANRSTSGTSRPSPAMYPAGPHASATPTAVICAPIECATSAIAGCNGYSVDVPNAAARDMKRTTWPRSRTGAFTD